MVLLGPWTARQCCLAIGYVYPMYKSSGALRRQDEADLLHWITFWTVNAFFWALELVGDTVVGWMPFYFEAKIAFLLWLVLPKYHGARELHEKWLAPTFVKHEEVIDVTLTDIKRRASEKVVQVCKDTAVLAMRRGSGVVVQSQQFVAAQLVQQALGKLGQSPSTESQELRVPSMLSFLSGTTATTTAPLPPRKPTSASSKSEAKEERSTQALNTPVGNKTAFLDTADNLHFERKAKNEEAKIDSAQSKAFDDEKIPTTIFNARASPKKMPSPPKSAPVPVAAPPSRQEKSKELVSHFKKLLVKGFRLKYFPSEGVLKQRTLRLQDAQSRYLIFESTGASGADAAKKKSVKLFVHNVRRIAAGTGDDHDAKSLSPVAAEVDGNLAFVLDNGKTTLLFEAENQKTRDLLVAGMRLLMNEHKRHDTAALTTLAAFRDKHLKQNAFDRMLYALIHHQTGVTDSV